MSLQRNDFGFGPFVAEADSGFGFLFTGDNDEALDESSEGNGEEDVAGGAGHPVTGKGGSVFFDRLGVGDFFADTLAIEEGEAVAGEEDDGDGD